ncbi:MAG TPA: rRNA maturation RNase YbeY [Pyrinomonadaceae bacterium]|nr:rRNA maturation RNase YbeY [Pyrinomonadaceae bacterium]
MPVEIVNRQRKIKVNPEIYRQPAESAIAAIKKAEGKTVTIAFVSDRKMRELNNEFRGKDATTDVLSFPNETEEFDTFDTENQNSLGDVVISVEQAQKQAGENNLSLDLEIKQLILHGILHLSGYDHEADAGEMNTLELELRDKLGIQ